ncbi:hypothetical protein P4C99_09490 [Pontiellaceae bacterium B1224]|nr:hypothetical protein [Pontiellaceae bacterium B1224]
MKRITPLALALTLLCGCTSKPITPKPHPEKYTFQVIALDIPESELPEVPPLDLMKIVQADLGAFILNSKTSLREFPLVIAGLTESVTNDQTKAVSLPVDYSLVDGVAVATEEIQHLGYLTAVTVNDVQSGQVDVNLLASHKKLMGHDTYQAGDGVTVEMPYMEGRAVDTQITLTPNSWVMMGGLMSEESEGNQEYSFICARVIPPLNN